MLDGTFNQEKIEGQDYIFSTGSSRKAGKPQTTFLMPDYDEYGISYKNRSALIEKGETAQKNLKTVSQYSHLLIVDGLISGTWKLTNDKSPVVEVAPFSSVPATKRKAIDRAIKKYRAFVAH